jgi:hypothetical protein
MSAIALQVSAANQVLVDAVMAKLHDKVVELVDGGAIGEGAVATHAVIRIEYGNGKHVDWVSTDGQVFNTRSESNEIDRPMAPVVPSAIKALDPAKVGSIQPTDKAIEKAKTVLRNTFRGFFATLESGVFCEKGWSRTLPGVPGKRYAPGRLGEIQKYADANEKIGL